jgi:hypothetical protein
LFSSRQENEKLVDDRDLVINEIEKDNHHQVARLRPRSCTIDGEAVACGADGIACFEMIRCWDSNETAFMTGYHGLVTHLFQKGDEYIEQDVVYGVKEPLIVDFVKRPPGKAPNGEMMNQPFYEVRYDFVLKPRAAALAAAE